MGVGWARKGGQMAYTQGGWRGKESSGKVALGLRVSVGLQDRVRVVGGQLKGRWTMSQVLELGLECLEKREVPAGLFYSEKMTTEELKEKHHDMGWDKRKR